MNRKFKQVLSVTQQNKLQQLQLEIEALEKQIDIILKDQQLTTRRESPIYLSHCLTQTGIKLADLDSYF